MSCGEIAKDESIAKNPYVTRIVIKQAYKTNGTPSFEDVPCDVLAKAEAKIYSSSFEVAAGAAAALDLRRPLRERPFLAVCLGV